MGEVEQWRVDRTWEWNRGALVHECASLASFFGFQGFLEGLGLLEVLFILPLGGVGGFVSWGRGRKFVLLVACLAFDCLGMGVCYMVFVDFILLYLHLVMFVGGL